MQPGKIVLVAFITSVLTGAGTYGVLHLTVGKRAQQRALASAPLPAAGEPQGGAAEPVGSPAASGDDAEVARQPDASAGDDNPTPATPPNDQPRVTEANTTVTDIRRHVVVPKVAGVRLAVAMARLGRAKLRYTVSYTYDEDHSERVVLRQRPAPGARVKPGSTVRLVVNREY